MKKLFKWIAKKNANERKAHPVRYNIGLIVLMLILNAMLVLAAIVPEDRLEHPIRLLGFFVFSIENGGIICHLLDRVIGRYTNDWRIANIVNPQIIQLIQSLEKAEQDITEGKIAWIGNFYDPSKERVETTRVPIEEYLVDPKPAEEPTVSRKTPE